MTGENAGERKRSRVFFVLPLMVCIVLSGAFYWKLNHFGNGKEFWREGGQFQVPDFDLEEIPGLKGADGRDVPGFTVADLRNGEAKVLTVWASWCGYCRLGHESLRRLARRGVTVYGVVYRDDPERVRRFLEGEGNPFERIVMDPRGAIGIDLGISGVPETFLIDGSGRIDRRYIGPIAEDVGEMLYQRLSEIRGEAVASEGGGVSGLPE